MPDAMFRIMKTLVPHKFLSSGDMYNQQDVRY